MEGLKNLDSGNRKKDYLRFTLPTVLSLGVFALYTTVDGVFVGRFLGPEAMAAVNLGAPFLNLLFAVAVLLAVGSSTIIANTLGQGDRQRADRLFTQNVVVAVSIGLLVTVVTELFLTPVCRALGAEADTLSGVRAYIGCIAPFALFVMLEYTLEVLVKTDGHPRLAAVAVICGGITNIVLDYVALAVLKLGIPGAAVATGLAESVTALIFLSHFVFSKERTLHFTRFSLDGTIYGRLLPLGIPDGVSELCVGMTIWLYNRRIWQFYGTSGVACFAIVTSLNRLLFNLFLGTSQGMQPLVSYHRGRQDEAACGQLLRCALGAQAVVAVVSFALVWALKTPLATLFLAGKGEALVPQTVAMLKPWSVSFLVMGVNLVAIGYLTARERPMQAITLSVGRGLAFQAAALFGLSAVFGGQGIFWAPVLCESVCAVLSVLFLRRTHAE
jgi:putative MATE family efflux protein